MEESYRNNDVIVFGAIMIDLSQFSSYLSPSVTFMNRRYIRYKDETTE